MKIISISFLMLLLVSCSCTQDCQTTIWLNCTDVESGIAEVQVMIAGKNLSEIRAFGCELNFDNSLLAYSDIWRGALTEDFNLLDGNLVSQRVLRIGGIIGDSFPIKGEVSGELFRARFNVISQGVAQYCLTNYMDDLAMLQPNPACAVITYRR